MTAMQCIAFEHLSKFGSTIQIMFILLVPGLPVKSQFNVDRLLASFCACMCDLPPCSTVKSTSCLSTVLHCEMHSSCACVLHTVSTIIDTVYYYVVVL